MKNLSIRKFALTTKMSSRKLLRQLSALSIGSTQTVEGALHKPEEDVLASSATTTAAAAATPKKTVQINESDNEWHYPEDGNGDELELSLQDIERLWYNGEQVQTFREDALRAASKWAKQADGTSPTATARALTRAYESSSSSHQAARYLKDICIPAHLVGLESWIIRKKCVDERKDAVVHVVLEHQEAVFSDESVRAEKISAAYRAHSKASAYFAAQIAVKAWLEDA